MRGMKWREEFVRSWMVKSAVILLSGGLDSLVSLGLVRKNYENMLALTFDYGQKAVQAEIDASQKICVYYKILHKVIQLDWLKEITHTALVSDEKVPTDIEDYTASMKAVWVPNRNGLFLNIAACYADAEGCEDIIIGANKEEGETFSDNTIEFANRVSAEFEYSTLVKPRVVAPLINYNKDDIVKKALENNIPLEFVKSCYIGGEKNCGRCESCLRLKSALKNNGAEEYIKLLF